LLRNLPLILAVWQANCFVPIPTLRSFVWLCLHSDFRSPATDSAGGFTEAGKTIRSRRLRAPQIAYPVTQAGPCWGALFWFGWPFTLGDPQGSGVNGAIFPN
jgi:hypothetical protein